MANLDPKTIVAVCQCPLCGSDYEFKVTTRLNKIMATCTDMRCSSQFKISAPISQEMMRDYIANGRQPIKIDMQIRKPKHDPQNEPKPAGQPERQPSPIGQPEPAGHVAPIRQPEPTRSDDIFADYGE